MREYLTDVLATFVGFVVAVLATLYLEDGFLPELSARSQELKAIAATLTEFQLGKMTLASVIGTFCGAFIGALIARDRALQLALYVCAIMLLLNWGRFAGYGFPRWVQFDLVFGMVYVSAFAGWVLRRPRRPAVLTDV